PIPVPAYPVGGFLDCVETVQSKQSGGDVSQCRHDLWTASCVGLVRVFMPSGIAHVVAFVLNSPMLADIFVQIGRFHVIDSATGDDPCVLFAEPGSGEAKYLAAYTRDLPNVREVDTGGVGNPGRPLAHPPMPAFLHHMTG